MSNGSGFLGVIRVLETVGAQVRVVWHRKWSGGFVCLFVVVV